MFKANLLLAAPVLRCTLALLLCVVVATTAQADLSPLGSTDVLISGGTALREYSHAGALVQSITVPAPPVGSGYTFQGITVSPDGRLHVVQRPAYGDCYLSTYDFATQAWSQHTMTGWTIQAVTYWGGISSDANYVYVPDEIWGTDSTQGIIRFPLADLSAPERFATSYLNIHSVKAGLDGLLYGLERTGQGNLHVFDPVTLAHLRDVSVDHSASVESVAVAANGDIYTLDINGTVWHHTSDGTVVASTSYSGIGTDMQLGSNGEIWLGSGGDKFTRTDTSLAAFSQFDTPASTGAFNDIFVSHAVAQVPEPGWWSLLAVASATMLAIRFRRRQRRQ